MRRAIIGGMPAAPLEREAGMPSRRQLLRGADRHRGRRGLDARRVPGAARGRRPGVPFLERAAISDEAVLIQTYRQASALAALAARVPAPLAAEVTPQHQRQATVLLDILTAGGVPRVAIDPVTPTPVGTPAAPGLPSTADPPAATPASTTTPSSPQPPADPAELAAAELEVLAPAALTALAAALAHRTLFTAVGAHHAATATLLGATPAWPAAPALPAVLAARALDATRAARYAGQVAAARLTGAHHNQALATLTTLDRRIGDLAEAASGVAAPAPLGHPLPFPVATADDAIRLLATALGPPWSPGGLQSAADLPVAAPAYPHLVRLHTEAVLLARPLGGGADGVPRPGRPVSELVPDPFRRQFQAVAHDPEAPSAAEWVSRLPRLLDALLGDRDLRPDGATRWGWRALVVPVVSPVGPAALKVGWPHPGARHEHLALRHWAGGGTVPAAAGRPDP